MIKVLRFLCLTTACLAFVSTGLGQIIGPGLVPNSGEIDIISTTDPANLQIPGGGATLIGGGTVTLSGLEAGINAAPGFAGTQTCLLYTSPSPRDATLSRMPSSA